VRITLEIRDGIPASDALKRLAGWYASHERDSKAVPMRGVFCYRDGITICARDYRKTPCFVIFREVQE
jgi:hypothetical protein